jgi:hypothetical protein
VALTVTHAYEATGADDPEAEINRAEWNDPHVIEGDYLRKATVTLSSADILDLHNTPVTLVAAPGAGKYLVPHRVVMCYTHGTTSYATGGGNPIINYAAGATITEVSGVVGQTDDYLVISDGTAGNNDLVGAPSLFVNKAITADGDGNVLTDGDGTLTVTVWYSIEDVPA